MPEDIPELLRRGHRYALALTADPVAADDLLQEGWAAVLQARGPRTAPYLFRAIRSRWVDARRRAARRPEELAEVVVPVRPAQERLVAADALWRGLAALTDEQREVVYLCAVEGWTASEVAERTGRNRNTVLSHLRRGKAALKRWLTGTGLEVAR